MRQKMRILLPLLIILFLCIPASADHSTLRQDTFNTNPDMHTATGREDGLTFWDHEQSQRDGEQLTPFVHSGGTHTTSGTLISAPFATVAYVPERISQSVTAITYVASATDQCWVVISSDNDGITSWTRVGSTAYYYMCEGDGTPNEPTLPDNSAWLMQVEVVSSALTKIHDKRTMSPFMNEAENAFGGSNPLQNIEQYLGAGLDAFVYSGCLPIVPTSSLTIDAFACTALVEDGSTPPRLIPVIQVADTLAVADSSTVWLAISADFDTTPSGCGAGSWAREAGTHFISCANGTQPDTPSKAVIISEVTVSGSVITAMRNLAYRSPGDALRKEHRITSWGAAGDGTTDDTLAINNALGATVAGSQVFIPDGTYLISDGLIVNKAMRIYGTGTIATNAAFLQTTDATANGQYMMFYVTGNHVTFDGITLDAGAHIAVSTVGIWSEGTNTHVRNSTFQNFVFEPNGIGAGDACPGTGCIGTGVLFRPSATKGICSQNYFTEMNSACTNQSASSALFINNYFEAPATDDFDTPLGTDGGIGTRIIGNTIIVSSGSLNNGSLIQATSGAKRTLIANNVIIGQRSGVAIYVWDGNVSDVQDTMIVNNYIDGNSHTELGNIAMIRVEDQSSRTIIDGNTIVNVATGSNSSVAINVVGAETIVRNNFIRVGSGDHAAGILYEKLDDTPGTIVIENNDIYTNGTCISGSTGDYLLSLATIRNNRLDGCPTGINMANTVANHGTHPVHMENNVFSTLVTTPVTTGSAKWDNGMNAGGSRYPHRLVDGLTAATFMWSHEPPNSAWGEDNREAFTQGDTFMNVGATSGGTAMWFCTESGTFGTATDSTGDTNGTTTISGMTDTSDFAVGDFVDISADFTNPRQIQSKTSTTIVLDVAASGTTSNVTVDTSDPVFTALTLN